VTQLHDLTALEQGAAVRRGEVSPAELVEHYLERIGRLSDEVGAFVTVTADLARERARALEGAADGHGPLRGVPTAVKDLNLTAGVRTTFGSTVFADFVPDVSDEVVLRLEAAGTVSLGKTSTPEFGTPCYTEPDVAPPARTPWDLTRTAGGSSGGAGAAVAAGLVPLAQGSDGGGSIRIPASCCGLVGFKPSRGRISAGPMYGDVVGLSTAGPLARTVRDAAALLDVLAGPAVGDPTWAAPLPPEETYLDWCDRAPGRLRVARFATPVITDVPVDAEVLAAYEGASRLLEELGHDVEDVEVPMGRDAVPVFETCWAVGTAASVPPGREDDVRPLTRWLATRGLGTSGPAYALAVGELRRVAAATVRTLAPYDAVLTPTLAQLPAPIGSLRDDEHPERDFENQKAFTPWTSAWNVTGMPAVSLPLHHTPADLPVGVMLAGRPGEDHRLLALAAQVEAASSWRHRTPPCW